MTITDFMESNYQGKTLADFVQTVSLEWTDTKGIDLPDDIMTTVKIMDTAGNELSDLLPFDKDHPANNADLYTWSPLFERNIADVRTGNGFDYDYEIILE